MLSVICTRRSTAVDKQKKELTPAQKWAIREAELAFRCDDQKLACAIYDVVVGSAECQPNPHLLIQFGATVPVISSTVVHDMTQDARERGEKTRLLIMVAESFLLNDSKS
jgi:hypothetical protein